MVLTGLILLFILLKITPGRSNTKFISTAFSIERQQELHEFYGNNSSFIAQLFNWLKNAITLNFGHSTQSGLPVSRVVFSSLLPTFMLSILAIFWGLAIGFPLALISSIRKDSLTDKTITLVMVLLYSMPAYWIGLFLVQIFSFNLGFFPSSQLFDINIEYPTLITKLQSMLFHLLLPSISLGLSFVAFFHKYLKNKISEVLDSTYVLAAKARGLNKSIIVFSYIIPNLILPLLSLFSTLTPLFFSGAVTIEYIFSIPGVGRTMINAAVARDIPLIMGGAAISFMAIMLINSIYDLLLILFNPKVKSEWINESNS